MIKSEFKNAYLAPWGEMLSIASASPLSTSDSVWSSDGDDLTIDDPTEF